MRNLPTALLALVLASPIAAQQQVSPIGGSAGYVLHPGDVLRISVWGHADLSGEFQVDENGQIQYPIIGEIDTRNLTVADLRERMREGLGQLFNSPFVTVTPLFRMAVLGEIARPGLYTVDPTLSVLDVVALAGGATRVGNLGKIKLLRGGSEQRVNFNDLTMRGRTLQEVGVRSGDQIVIPRRFFTREDLGLLLTVVQVGLTVAVFINTVN